MMNILCVLRGECSVHDNKLYLKSDVKQELTSDELLKVILSYVAKIADEKNLNKLLMLMADMGREMVLADRCTLWLLDQTRNELWTKVAHGVNEIRIPSHSGLVGYAVQKGASVFIDNAYEDDRFNQEVDKKTGYRTNAILVIPFRNNDGEIMGAYQAINKMTESGIFSQQDAEHLTLAASYAGKSIEAAILHNEIEETQKEIIFAMGEIGEVRSKETGNHVKRVAEYSYLLALKYGLSEEEAELLRTASPMHDIGKVAIPDGILQKPGKLTDEEFTLMKTHSTIGYNLLKNSNRHILKAAAIVAHEHHEKWNGTGYPRGIKGVDTHIYARITAIADVFDALGSERVYKSAWDLDRIIKLFREEKGKHFDPKLVDLFLENIDKLVEIRDKYKDN
jgi:response regulator RpfG family c-di-GMP phosphodiesterase